jgi:hypothetical protein
MHSLILYTIYLFCFNSEYQSANIETILMFPLPDEYPYTIIYSEKKINFPINPDLFKTLKISNISDEMKIQIQYYLN